MKPTEALVRIANEGVKGDELNGWFKKFLALAEAVEGVSVDQYKWNIDAARQQDATGFEYLYRAALALKEK